MKYSPLQFILEIYNVLDYGKVGIDWHNASDEEICKANQEHEDKIQEFFKKNENAFPNLDIMSYGDVFIDLHDCLVKHLSFSNKGILTIKANGFLFNKITKNFDFTLTQEVTLTIDVKKLPENGLLLSRNATIDLIYFDDKELAVSFWQKNTGKEIVQSLEINSISCSIGAIKPFLTKGAIKGRKFKV